MLSQDPRVSVIIPVYNRSETISRSINSALKQDYENTEIIIVDDGSEDDSRKIIESFDDSRIKAIYHDKNQGANAARNTGINAASGDVISFLDSDDEWRQNKLSSDINALKSSTTNCGAVYCGITHANTKSDTCDANSPIYSGDLTKHLLTQGNFIGSFSALSVTRTAIQQVEQLDERFPSYQDWEFYIRLSTATKFEVIESPLVVRHSGNWNQISDEIDTKYGKTRPLMIDKFAPVARQHGNITEHQFKSVLHYTIAHAALRNKHYSKARDSFMRSIYQYPLKYEAWIYLVFTIYKEYLWPLRN